MVLLLSCAGNTPKKTPDNTKFAIMGNTYSESPYCEAGLKISPVIEKINENNPLFVIHIGDIVCGGKRWLGVKKKDIEKQFSDFFSIAERLRPILYTVVGDMDILNNSSAIYSIYSRREEYYSFNYGNTHFIVLGTTDPLPGEIGKKQMLWLKKELELYKNSSAIFIFTHHPVFIPRGVRSESDDSVKENEMLHNLFLKYPVKAVFSGHLQIFHEEETDGIKYIIAGCGDYDKKYYTRNYQYYIVDYFDGAISIQPNKL